MSHFEEVLFLQWGEAVMNCLVTFLTSLTLLDLLSSPSSARLEFSGVGEHVQGGYNLIPWFLYYPAFWV
jgi:hypothetical protein